MAPPCGPRYTGDGEFGFNRRATLELNFADETVALAVKNEINSAVINWQKGVEASFERRAHRRVAVADIADLTSIPAHGAPQSESMIKDVIIMFRLLGVR
jgi:hypothetical protein